IEMCREVCKTDANTPVILFSPARPLEPLFIAPQVSHCDYAMHGRETSFRLHPYTCCKGETPPNRPLAGAIPHNRTERRLLTSGHRNTHCMRRVAANSRTVRSSRPVHIQA